MAVDSVDSVVLALGTVRGADAVTAMVVPVTAMSTTTLTLTTAAVTTTAVTTAAAMTTTIEGATEL